MKFIKGQNRTQSFLFPVSLEQSISHDNEVRVIDLFVESLSLKEYEFDMDFIENGRPAYHPSDLLKLFIYGYLNRLRSSRVLEKESKRNIEVMWLLKSLQPDHNTISNFRKDNSKAIKKVFRATVQIAKHFELIGGKLIAGDSTKLRAQNSKKNNFNQKKIDRHVTYIDNKLEEYNHALSQQDNDNKEFIQKEIEKHQERKNKYKELEKQLQDTDESQISTSDPESRQMIIRNNITEVAYNVQTTVDAKHNIPIDYKVTNNNDSKAMGNMVRRAKSILRTNDFTALYDKGYHTGSEMKIAQKLGINTIVAIPDVASSTPNKSYCVANFLYNKEDDTYACPEHHTLSTNGSWYVKNSGKHRTNIRVKHYKTKDCKSCQKLNECTKNTRGRGRVIERSEYAAYVEQNRINVENNKNAYKRRQAIVEHPYGTIKRQWGFSYILTKQGKARASADVGLMFTAYNLRRIINILGHDVFKKYLSVLVYYILSIFVQIRLILRRFAECIFLKYICKLNFNYC
ncbi:MAG: IS1182 family transposase [Erysipelotrichaceae bacterium]|nr:IS1182 family transposase [Erysipelotrichaceae bacterium]